MLRPALGALAVGATVLLGCTDDRQPATTEVGTRLEALVVPGSTCDLKTVKSLSNTEFPSADQKKASNFLKLLSGTTAEKRAGGFGLLDLLAKDFAAGTLPSTHTAQNASDLTIATANCVPGAIFPETSELSRAFGPSGMYAVRGLGGGSASENPVFSLDGFAAVQAPTNGTVARDFFSWLHGPSVIFGWPLSQNEEFRNEAPVGTGYQLYAISVGAFSGASGIVGVCVGSFPSKLRVQHEQQIEEAVDPALILGWPKSATCPTPTASLTLHERLLKAGFDLWSPQPLLALATVGSGTGAKKLSPFGAVDAGSVHLSFTCTGCANPADGKVGPLSPAPRVRATGDQGSPLPGVQITITVSGNSGSFKVCNGPNMLNGTSTATTGSDGFADFTGLSIDKAGGYTLTATSTYVGFSQTQQPSNLFNLQNGSFTCP